MYTWVPSAQGDKWVPGTVIGLGGPVVLLRLEPTDDVRTRFAVRHENHVHPPVPAAGTQR
jgi:hypothetical protein